DEVHERTEAIDELNWEVSGPINARIEETRLAMRGLELETRAVLVSRAEEIAMLEDQIAAVEKTVSETDQLVRQIIRRYGEDSDLEKARGKISEERTTELEQKKAEPKARIDQVTSKLADAPPAARAAIDKFLEARRSAA